MSLSRLYRPKQFKDVCGQSHITETLRKEVETGQLGHAFLFSGPRGVGKTTSARIFAKALLNDQNEKGEPPLESECSKEIDAGKCIDLIEIDAASYTGVDNVREAIVEHVRFAPARWKRKVYIIDECHMLSASAWNAMLKTLEEPPEYAFFILATTELHKVPETIKSRCQRFEFKRIEDNALAERLKEIAKEELVKIDDGVIKKIVHASDGCLRDAESLMGQIISFSGDHVTEDVASLVLPQSLIPESVELLKCISRIDLVESFGQMKKMIESGISATTILSDLIVIMRSLIQCQDSRVLERLQNGDEGDRAIAQIVGDFSVSDLSYFALTLLERRQDAKRGTDPVFALELALTSMFLRKSGQWTVDSGQVLEESKKKVASEQQDLASKSRIVEKSHRESLDEGVKQQSGVEKGQRDRGIEGQKSPEDDGASESQKAEEVKNEAVILNQESGGSEADVEKEVQNSGQNGALDFDIHDIRKYWNIIVREVEQENKSIPFVLKVCRPERLENVTVILRFQYPFHREKLIEDIKIKRLVEKAVRKIMKHDNLLIDGFCGDGVSEDSLEHVPMDIVSKVLNTFGGQVVE